MSTDERVTSLTARRAAGEAALDEKLLAAYREAKGNDDGRRVERAALVFNERRRL